MSTNPLARRLVVGVFAAAVAIVPMSTSASAAPVKDSGTQKIDWEKIDWESAPTKTGGATTQRIDWY